MQGKEDRRTGETTRNPLPLIRPKACFMWVSALIWACVAPHWLSDVRNRLETTRLLKSDEATLAPSLSLLPSPLPPPCLPSCVELTLTSPRSCYAFVHTGCPVISQPCRATPAYLTPITAHLGWWSRWCITHQPLVGKFIILSVWCLRPVIATLFNNSVIRNIREISR